MVEYCTWKIPVFWVRPTRGWTTLWGCGLERPWRAVEKMEVIEAKQCNLFRTWFIGMWTNCWANCVKCHHNCGIVPWSFTKMFLHCRKLETGGGNLPNTYLLENKTSVTWLIKLSIPSLRVAKWKRLSNAMVYRRTFVGMHDVTSTDVHKFHRLKCLFIKMHPFCIHSVGFTLDTQLDVQHSQFVLFDLLCIHDKKILCCDDRRWNQEIKKFRHLFAWLSEHNPNMVVEMLFWHQHTLPDTCMHNETKSNDLKPDITATCSVPKIMFLPGRTRVRLVCVVSHETKTWCTASVVDLPWPRITVSLDRPCQPRFLYLPHLT